MASEVTVSGYFEWVDEHADGTTCEYCGDAAWGRQWRLMMYLHSGKLFCWSAFVLCDSCGNDANDVLAEGESS